MVSFNTAYLVTEIEQKRAELVRLGMEKGLKHPEVLHKSQMLDNLVNQYYRLTAISRASN